MPARSIVLIDDHDRRRGYLDLEAQNVGCPVAQRHGAIFEQILFSLIAGLIVGLSMQAEDIRRIAIEGPLVRKRNRVLLPLRNIPELTKLRRPWQRLAYLTRHCMPDVDIIHFPTVVDSGS